MCKKISHARNTQFFKLRLHQLCLVQLKLNSGVVPSGYFESKNQTVIRFKWVVSDHLQMNPEADHYRGKPHPHQSLKAYYLHKLQEIWAEENISRLLEKVLKNKEMFKIFSKRVKQNGFNQSVELCHIKVKKLF